MQALTVTPRQPGSVRLETIPEPDPAPHEVLVSTMAVGVCGTDREIIEGKYGSAPPGEHRLILGHESLGRVEQAPATSGFSRGDLVVGIVRRPDPVPCASCAAGQWDMCLNGLYTECGIKQRHGFAAERFSIEPEYLVRLDPALARTGVLLEPASIVAKAWEHIERIGNRATWAPKKVLVTGAGPVGLLAAMIGVQRGLEMHVLDLVHDGPKPALVRELGATYHVGSAVDVSVDCNIVLECTGVGQLAFDIMQNTPPAAIVCLTGLSSGGRVLEVDASAFNRQMVLENDVVFGSVNANRSHYELAAEALAKADLAWLEGIITRRVPLAQWEEAFARKPGDVKTILEFNAS